MVLRKSFDIYTNELVTKEEVEQDYLVKEKKFMNKEIKDNYTNSAKEDNSVQSLKPKNQLDKKSQEKINKTLKSIDNKLKEDKRYELAHSITSKLIPDNSSAESREIYEVLGTFFVFNFMDKYLDV